MTVTEVIQKVQLVEGTFTPSEASDIISALIGEKINFHKLQRLSLTEGSDTANCTYPNNRIEELLKEKKIAKEFLALARNEKINVRINGTLEISFDEE